MTQLKKEPIVFLITILTFGVLFYFIAYPLYAVFQESAKNEAGKFVGLANYIHFVQSEYFRQVFYNTLFISVIATAGAVIVGMIFAYAMTRTDLPLKSLFMITAILPMITPPFINAFALILLLGRNGVINVFLERWLGFKFVIYGYHGVILSEILTTFPLAYLIVSASFSGLDSLYHRFGLLHPTYALRPALWGRYSEADRRGHRRGIRRPGRALVYNLP
jgi:iron(III) transport system permease protein